MTSLPYTPDLQTMWNDKETDAALLSTWLRHTPSMKLASSPDGRIYWANDAFCDWSGYTLAELKKMTWIQLSVPGSDLDADKAELTLLDDYKLSYTVRKQYIPKNERPVWGKLTVIRYPVSGPIECCLCTWEPLKNGTAEAFAMAVESVNKMETKLAAVAEEIRTMQSQTEQDRAAVFISRLITRYPRAALSVLLVIIGMLAGDTGLSLLQKFGLFQQTPIIIEDTQGVRHAAIQQSDEISYPIRHTFPAVSSRSVTTPAGLILEWKVTDDARSSAPRSMPGTTQRLRRGYGGIGRSGVAGAGEGGGTDSVRGRSQSESDGIGEENGRRL